MRDAGVVDRTPTRRAFTLRYTNFRTADSYRYRDRLDSKPKHRENTPVFLEVILQLCASARKVYGIDIRRNYNN